MSNASLLPANATALEHRCSLLTLGTDRLPVPLRDIWNPYTCPVDLLPWLAWTYSVDDWNPDWSEELKRETIAASPLMHRRKGSVGSVRRALDAFFGAGNYSLQEGFAAGRYDGRTRHDGSRYYGQEEHWARYSVTLNHPISISQARDIREVLASIAPARCELFALDYQQALNAYDNTIRYDGNYTHGIA